MITTTGENNKCGAYNDNATTCDNEKMGERFSTWLASKKECHEIERSSSSGDYDASKDELIGNLLVMHHDNKSRSSEGIIHDEEFELVDENFQSKIVYADDLLDTMINSKRGSSRWSRRRKIYSNKEEGDEEDDEEEDSLRLHESLKNLRLELSSSNYSTMKIELERFVLEENEYDSLTQKEKEDEDEKYYSFFSRFNLNMIYSYKFYLLLILLLAFII